MLIQIILVRAPATNALLWRFLQIFEETVQTAKKVAKPGDVVLFSPASASFDMFKNFEERGNKFKELVNNL